MTTDEFDLIAGAIKASYPASKILADATAMRFWYAMLKDVDYPMCIYKHISADDSGYQKTMHGKDKRTSSVV